MTGDLLTFSANVRKYLKGPELDRRFVCATAVPRFCEEEARCEYVAPGVFSTSGAGKTPQMVAREYTWGELPPRNAPENTNALPCVQPFLLFRQ